MCRNGGNVVWKKSYGKAGLSKLTRFEIRCTVVAVDCRALSLGRYERNRKDVCRVEKFCQSIEC